MKLRMLKVGSWCEARPFRVESFWLQKPERVFHDCPCYKWELDMNEECFHPCWMLCEGRMWQELPPRPHGLSKIAVLYLEDSAVLSELLTGMWKRGTRLCACFSQPSCTNWVPPEGNCCTCERPGSPPLSREGAERNGLLGVWLHCKLIMVLSMLSALSYSMGNISPCFRYLCVWAT